MLERFDQYRNEAPVILRLLFGLVFLSSGIIKMQVVDKLADTFHFLPFPMFWAWLVVVIEVIGGLFFILGLFVRWVSIPLAIDMGIAAGILWKTTGLASAGSAVLGFAGCIALLILGAGIFSLEKAAFGKEF